MCTAFAIKMIAFEEERRREIDKRERERERGYNHIEIALDGVEDE